MFNYVGKALVPGVLIAFVIALVLWSVDPTLALGIGIASGGAAILTIAALEYREKLSHDRTQPSISVDREETSVTGSIHLLNEGSGDVLDITLTSVRPTLIIRREDIEAENVRPTVHAELAKDAVKCPFCGDPLGSMAIQVCPLCQTPHHRECWQSNGGCTTLGCPSRMAA